MATWKKWTSTVLVNGQPEPNVKVYVYEPGTTNEIPIYEDEGVTQITQPILTDSQGRYAFFVDVETYPEIRLYLEKDGVDFSEVNEDLDGVPVPGAGGGAGTFTELTDTPSSYVGRGGDVVVVKTTEDGIETQPWPVTGTVLNVFLSDDAADIGSYYYMYPDETGDGSTELTSPSLTTGDDQLLWSFVTEAGEPGINQLALGAYTATLFFKKSGNKDVRVYWKLFKRDTGGTETEILQSAVSDYLTADNSQYLISGYLNEDQALDPTDRLVLKLYANVSGTGTDVTVTLTMEGDYDSRLTINVLSSAFNLDRLSDVTISSPSDNELLAYDSGSGKWINQTPREAGVLAADGSVPFEGNLNADGHSIDNVSSLSYIDSTSARKFSFNLIPYSGNPVFSGGAWGSVWKEGDTYHLYYSYGSPPRIGHATSSDGKTWTEDTANNPVLDHGADGKFDEKQVWLPIVWKEGSTWYMFYTGEDTDGNMAIGYATSADGVHWTRANNGDPVLTGAAGEWDENRCEAGAIIKVESTYYLYYNTVNVPLRQIGLATSTDLVNWTKDPNNPIFDGGATGQFCVGICKYGDYYYLFVPHYGITGDYAKIELYRCANPTFYPSEREFLGIVKSTGLSGWDSKDLDTPYVLTDDIYRNSFAASNGELWVYYSGQSDEGWNGIGLLTSAPSGASMSVRDFDPLPLPGEVFRITNAASEVFSATIDGNPTPTTVKYTGETNEGMFNGLQPYDGSSYWGHIILHNTTKGTSRKIVSVDLSTKTITTEASDDDWADGDSITCQSQTNTYVGYFDVDLSEKIGPDVEAVYLNCISLELDGVGGSTYRVCVHPLEERDPGKEVFVYTTQGGEATSQQFFMRVIDQKITVKFDSFTNNYVSLSVQGRIFKR